MKALVVPTAGKLELADIPMPEIGAYDALIRMEVCGICNSTDTKLIDGKMYWAPPFPFVLGHESVGRVTQVGPKVRKFKVGDRVTRPVGFWPGSRKELNAAVGGFCQWGIARDGLAMAEDGDHSLLDDYVVQRQMIVPAGLSAAEAALGISLSETASVFLTLPNIRGKTVAVAGAGVAGLAFMLWAKLAGAFVIAIGRRPERLAKARELGADAVVDTGSGNDPAAQLESVASGKVDGIIEATGDASLANRLLPAIEMGGFSVAYGVPATIGPKYDEAWKVADVQEQLCFAWVADMIARRWVRPEWFTSEGNWTLDNVIPIFDRVRRGELLKVFVKLE